MSFLARWLGAAEPESIESGQPSDHVREAAAAEAAGGDRRQRDVETAESQLRDVIAGKVLHGWLQNRNQTLMPLSVNLARLDEADRMAIVRFAALAAQAGGDAAAPDRIRAWLVSAGAGEAALSAFSDASDDPPSLPGCLAELARPDLASLGFVAALVAAHGGGPASRRFADFVAARLALPSTAIRSAERRYRA